MEKFEVVEILSTYRHGRTSFNDLEEAVKLTEKIAAAGGKCYVLQHTESGATKQLPIFVSGTLTDATDRGDFNDHSGLVERSTMERAYNKRGRL